MTFWPNPPIFLIRRSKYAAVLKQYSDKEIDEIFARQKDDEPIVRHPLENIQKLKNLLEEL